MKQIIKNIKNDEAIVIKGARVHNLKNISLSIPRDKLVVLTGPSGSGKSSLAFDTIYAEGQRRYVESLSVYARQFLDQHSKPDVESIDGLSPTISIEQKTSSHNPRSTVGTVTEVYDYLRLLYARIAKPSCYQCQKPIKSQSPGQIVDQILQYPEMSKLSILAPIAREKKGEFQKELLALRQRGFVRVKIDSQIFDLSDDIKLDKNKKHTIDVFVDRVIIKGDKGVLSTRISESVELALKLGSGMIVLQSEDTEILLSEKFACIECGLSYPSPEPRTFSFNSPMGSCPRCEGLGIDPKYQTDNSDKKELSLDEIDLQLTEISPETTPCTDCNGKRLRIESLHYFLNGQSIAHLSEKPISELTLSIQKLNLSEREIQISNRILKEILERLYFLQEVGVGYLSLSRSARTLSGGESQRIRLATQIGSSLVGVVYVLDEPSIGLHQKDNDRLISTLERLRDLGNTVLVVEHDRDTMERADWIVDLGPGAGIHGGEVIAQGNLETIKKSKHSLTAKYLRGELQIPFAQKRRPFDLGRQLTLKGVEHNNLKNLNVSFPLGLLTCVTGVSGSGKSTLIIDILYKSLARKLYRAVVGELKVKSIEGLELIDKIIDIDQSPIGRTPRSNPATYTGVFTLIRELFSKLPEAQIRGFLPGRFSFNTKGGRCEACEGDGVTRIEMHFLPDVFVQCEICRGHRYNRETLEILFKGKNISQILEMSALDALDFFEAIPQVKAKVAFLNDVGLGYLKLGQSATTLSGGEAQRIKLCKELSKRPSGKTVYILDEPSTGLHFDDIRKLVEILQSLVDQGNTVIIIEHNLDIIKIADHIIDLGPDGGKAGGYIVASGTPEAVVKNPSSHTGRYLKKYLHP